MMTKTTSEFDPGPIVLFGSGETSPSGRKIFEQIFQGLPVLPRVALLETPSGFELNSPQVVGRIAEFLHQRLKNYSPQIEAIPARKRGTPFSPDDPEIAAPLLTADLIFAGPGSPTYAVRQWRDSLAWHYLIARHRLGGALALASAAVIAIGAFALPVYEIYKVGEDPHWKAGLDFFAPYGLPLTFMPHWNNNDGGSELDTSRCFVGKARFEPLLEILPPGQVVVGIDENTALHFDWASLCCNVLGLGSVTLLRAGDVDVIRSGDSFPLIELGNYRNPGLAEGLPSQVWELALESLPVSETRPPEAVLTLVEQRQAARARKDWVAADCIRGQIAVLGWQVQDTPEGPVVSKQ